MKQFISYDKNNLVNIISTTEFNNLTQNVKETDKPVELNDKISSNDKSPIKLAYVCNWNQQCGISTYSKFIFDAMKDKLGAYKIFSETSEAHDNISTEDINYCWKRGTNLNDLVQQIKEYKPNVILLQHEWGLFPNAAHFMSFVLQLKKLKLPVIAIMHSVYEHLDKTIPLSVLDHVIVHSNAAKDTLKKLHFKGTVDVIPHGCPAINNSPELWNIFQNDYLMFGYGFGFKYKGVDVAIDAVKHLVDTDPKFKNLVYVYVCSESEKNKGVHNHYYETLTDKVAELGLQNNVLLLKGFLEEETLDAYLRIVKMVLFPYISEPNNTVFGASGAIKIAMSYGHPVIASKSHLFDDLEGVVIRISDYRELAQEIDKLFSSEQYRKEIVGKAHEYIANTSWAKCSQMYIDTMMKIKFTY